MTNDPTVIAQVAAEYRHEAFLWRDPVNFAAAMASFIEGA